MLVHVYISYFSMSASKVNKGVMCCLTGLLPSHISSFREGRGVLYFITIKELCALVSCVIAHLREQQRTASAAATLLAACT
jgi:hypothetical protein